MSATFELGKKGEAVVRAGLEKVYVLVKETPKDIKLQLEWADYVVVGNKFIGIDNMKVEVKTEERHTGNLFFETHSNVETNRPGWALTSTAHELYYLFWEDAIGYRLTDYQHLKFLFDYHKTDFIDAYQGKHTQHNLTRGKLVPIDWLKQNYTGVVTFDFSEEKARVEQGLK